MDVQRNLGRALHIEIPARITLASCVRGSHHVTRPIPRVEQLDGACLPSLASGGSELEESSGTVFIPGVGATAGERMGKHGEITHAHCLRGHNVILSQGTLRS